MKYMLYSISKKTYMKQLLFSGLVILTLGFTGKQTGIVLSGTVVNNVAVLHWENTTSYTIVSYTVRRKVNAGNLKNAYETVVVLDGSVTDFSVPMTNGKNTFLVAGLTTLGYGVPSNELTLNH